MFAFETGHAQGMSPTSPLRSVAVKTPRTPGDRCALAPLIRLMRAWAYGLRTNDAYTVPGRTMSATKLPRPVRNRSSSFLGIDCPNTESTTVSPALESADLGRSGFDRPDDVNVARAAAEVARDRHANLILRRFRVALKEVDRREDDARGAETALEPMVRLERLLDRVEATALREPPDRRDRAPVGLDREHRAGLHRLPIQEDRAGATVTRVAAHVRTREPQVVSEEVDEEDPWLHGSGVLRAVHVDRDHVSAVPSRWGSLRP